MRGSGRQWRDLGVALAWASLAVGPIWVGLVGLGLTPLPAAAGALVLLAALAWGAAPALEQLSAFLVGHRGHAIAAALAVAAAAVVMLKLSLFMHDPQRREWSTQPESDFYLSHSCLTGSTEGVDRAWRGENVYEVSATPKIVAGRFEADPIMYSPPFLVVPAALMLVSDDFIDVQRIWFALQAVTAIAAMLALAAYVGGAHGARAALTIPFFILASPFLLNLQIGNVQVTVLAAAMAGMVLFHSGRPKLGAAFLAGAIVAKLFPVICLVYLVGQRRWRWALYTGTWCVMLTLAAVALFGVQPIWDYLAALPGIMNGSTLATTPWTENLWLAPSNQSIYGATRKLVALGVSLVTPRVETAIQAAYGLATMASALVVGATTRSEAASDRSRLGQAIIWLALLNLASFRSPFLPDGYAYVGTLWLVTLLFAARLRFSWRDALILTIAWVLLTPIYGGRDELPQPFTLLVAVTLLTQGLVIAGTLGAVWMEWRHAGVLRAPARTRSLEHQPA